MFLEALRVCYRFEGVETYQQHSVAPSFFEGVLMVGDIYNLML
jgi:hypothetical protein